MKKKSVAKLLTAAISASMVLGLASPSMVGLTYAADSEITDAQCTNSGTKAPTPDDCLPSLNQYRYQKEELAAFVHYGPNTYSGDEWGWIDGKDIYAGKDVNEIFPITKETNVKQLVDTLWDAGFRKLIITAKHHNGFCIWQSDYTDYDMGSVTRYKDGKGDILEEISAECTKKGMEMGLYLSPWDFHEPKYGQRTEEEKKKPLSEDDYNVYYNNQLKEILSNEKYGNNGRFVEVWMDGANNSPYPQPYDFETWFDTIQKYEGIEGNFDSDCLLFGAGAHTTVRWIGNEIGYADENTWSKSRKIVDKDGKVTGLQHSEGQQANGDPAHGKFSTGFEDGDQWTVPECDARITSGWFWGENKKTPKTLKDLAGMYFNSVGHGSTLLLNVPLNTDGEVDPPTLERVKEFGQNINQTFQNNLAKSEDATIVASNVRGNDTAFKPGNTVDNDDKTFWTTEDGTNEGSLTVKWNDVKTFDVVSFEESILNGQRINNYKVEYKVDDNSQWQELKSGITVGPRRLVRTNPVSAKQLRITVSTPEGKVPMLTEIGVYKASKGFQLSGTAPAGMNVTSVGDTDKFKFEGSWHPETGSGYINGKNTYCNKANSSFTYTFTGSKVYLMGTVDPGHGEADIYIDNMDTPVKTINTRSDGRQTGTIIFESDDLDHGTHTIKLVAKTDSAIGVEAAYVINNDGKGMLEIENGSYTMDEDTDLPIKIKRVGGTSGQITAKLSPNPGTAIQKHFDTGLITTVTFEEGETEKVIEKAAHANRVTEVEGDKQFTLELTSDAPVVGLKNEAVVTIKDLDGYRGELDKLVEETTGLTSNGYESGWEAFTEAYEAAINLLADEEAQAKDILVAYQNLEAAKNALVARTTIYTAENPFVFPTKVGQVETLEAELATELINSDDADSDPDWDLALGEADWASGGKYVNCLAQKDFVKYAYNAPVEGTYEVKMTYASGSNVNKVKWLSDPAENIVEGQTEGLPKSENQGATATFTVTVDKAGAGTFIITAPDEGKGPQIDKFEIKLVEPKNPSDLSALTAEIENAEALLNSEIKPELSKKKVTELRILLRKAKGMTVADPADAVAAMKEELAAKMADMQVQFTIQASASENGTIDPAGEVKVYNGASKTFTMTPKDGYHVASVVIDGVSTLAAPQTKYTFDEVTEEGHTIAVTFAKDEQPGPAPDPDPTPDPTPDPNPGPTPDPGAKPDPKPNPGQGSKPNPGSKPTPGSKPGAQTVDKTESNKDATVQTGDVTPIAIFAVLLVLSAGTVIVIVSRRKKN